MLRFAPFAILASTYVGCASTPPSSPVRTRAAPASHAAPSSEVCVPIKSGAVDATLDSDGDGIANVADMCTEAEEDFDGVDDGDGCPEMTLAVLVNRSIHIEPPGDRLLRTTRREIAFVNPLVFDRGILTSENDEALTLLAQVMIAGDVDGHVECAIDGEAKAVVAWLTANGVPADHVHAVRHASDAIADLDDATRAATGRCIVRYSQCALVEHEKRMK